MRSVMEISSSDGEIILQWFKSVGYEPLENTVLRMVEFCDRHANGVINFNNLNAASTSSELAGKLKWEKSPTPRNYREIVAGWLKTLPPAFRNGFGGLAGQIAHILERQFGNHYSLENLNSAFAMFKRQAYQETFGEPEPEQTPTSKKLFTNLLRNTGRVNHAHANKTPVEPTEQQAKENIAKTLLSLSKVHPEFVRRENAKVKSEMDAGKNWKEISQSVRESTSDYLAGVAIAEMLNGAPGATPASRESNRAHLRKIVEEGIQQMTKSNVARLVKLEFDGMDSRSVR